MERITVKKIRESRRQAQNDAALSKFVGHIGAIEEKLEKIKEHVANHMDTMPEEVNWGHVGSAAHLSSELDDILEFLGLDK